MNRPVKNIIIPAVIAATQEELDGMLEKIGNHAFLVQLDIMDGVFVPSPSLWFSLHLPPDHSRFEAHLMIQNPLAWIEENGKKVGTIIPHIETVTDAKGVIRKIKDIGCKAAMAINPETPVEKILPCLDLLDQVLVMTVNPGFYGSPFLPDTTDKIRRLRKIRPGLDIEVDGGITPDTIPLVHQAGANFFVSGSYLMKAENIVERMAILRAKVS